MATSRIGDPLGQDVHLANFHGTLGCDVGCQRGHIPGPIRVADASKDKAKKTTKRPSAPTKVDTIILHIYSPISGEAFTEEDYIKWFKAAKDAPVPDKHSLAPPPPPDMGRWFDAGINPEFFTDRTTGVKDFEKSLQRKGAIVVYIGHSTLDSRHQNRSLGLTPQAKNQPEIPNATLRTLLSKSAASLVIIASCDSKTAVGNISAGPPIIVQNSGANRKTLIPAMADAVAIFLFLLIGWELDGRKQPDDPHKGGHATINDALDATVPVFKNLSIDDRFELVHGDGSIILIP
jgi:hypothetical protein